MITVKKFLSLKVIAHRKYTERNTSSVEVKIIVLIVTNIG